MPSWLRERAGGGKVKKRKERKRRSIFAKGRGEVGSEGFGCEYIGVS